MTDPEIRIVPESAALAEQAAQLFVETAAASIATRGAFAVALSGGSTPRAMFQRLAQLPLRQQVEWSKLQIFWGDERTVPPDSPESNYHMARQALLNHVAVPAAQIHRMQGELDPYEAAAEYETVLRQVFQLGQQPRLPVFDLQLLGIGPDGHTASLFPGTPALHERGRLCVANPVPQLQTTRLTLTPPVITASALIVVLAAGREKAEAVARAIQGEWDFETTPSQLLRHAEGRVVWLLDPAAASRLKQ
ncbi:MAG TPA: 6-phosphogluconolactonase [Thermomicrobiaceae bacterium]|nr:6-phosphogluconolactonase [Thermomicrobiaceae bacterium]